MSGKTPAVLLPKTIKLWPLSRLVPYARNPREHTEDEVAALADQIRLRGWTNPILVDEKDGILAGHRRLRAAQLLGLKKVPVIVLTHLQEHEKRALVIADNQLALQARWNPVTLMEELEALRAASVDPAEAAFSPAELRALEGDPMFRPNYTPQQDHKPHTQEQVEAEGRRQADQFARPQELNRVLCPECGEEFYIDPATLEAKQ